MEQSTETKKQSGQRWIIILLAMLIVLLAVVLAVVLGRSGELRELGDNPVPKIGYASEATVLLDQDSLQAAMDAAMENARNSNVGLRYKNNAYSTDGINFECLIANSSANIYDMFLTIYADAELTDQIFLSGLVRPGSGFEKITLEHALESGDHRVYVALTQVDTDEETGEQMIKNQVVHTMDFHVSLAGD